MEILESHWLEIVTTVLGLIYIWLEYRASIWLWIVGIVMPAMQIYLYWSHGLYAFAGLTCYYTLAAVYGLAVWMFKKTRKSHQPLPIIYMPRRLYGPTAAATMALWAITYYFLIKFTDSPVPTLESLTDMPYYFFLYGLYNIIAIAGFFKWKQEAKRAKSD